MSLLEIKKLGDFDVNTDIDPSDLAPEVFTSGENYVLRDGKIQTFNGQALIEQPTLGSSWNNATTTWASETKVWETGSGLPQPSFNAARMEIIGNTYYLLGRSAINSFDGNTWFDLSSSVGYADLIAIPDSEYAWTTTKLGAIIVGNNPNHSMPEYYTPYISPPKFRSLPWSPGVSWPTAVKACKVIRSHNNFLFALGMIESGVEEPYSYRWSHPADINSIPYTWDENDISAIAGKSSLAGAGGIIVDGMSLRNEFCIYQKNAITLLDYSGDEFVWRTRQLSSSVGLINQNCIAEFNGKHLFLADGDLIVNDGNSLTSVLNRRMRSTLENTISNAYYQQSFLVIDPSHNEIWCCISMDENPNVGVAIIYNYVTDKISKREFDIRPAHMAYGQANANVINWDNIDKTWATTQKYWNTDLTSPFSNEMIGVINSDCSLYAYTLKDDISSFDTFLERLYFALDNEITVKTIVNMYPQVRCPGLMSFQIGSAMGHNEYITWDEPLLFNAADNRIINVRSTGMLHCWRIASVDNIPFSLTGIAFEYVTEGVR